LICLNKILYIIIINVNVKNTKAKTDKGDSIAARTIKTLNQFIIFQLFKA
jgi:hypothetical protein